VISDAAIACRGPVWSVRLLSRVPISQIRRLALDEGSRTSATMVKVLLSELYGIKPETVPLRMEQEPDLVDADAVLVIGDRAMHPPAGIYEEIWDLGDRWCRWTGLPFVFAMWVSKHHLGDAKAIKDALEASRDEGIAHLEEIAKREAGPHGLTVPDLHRYFARNLHFKLGPRELDGLEMYRLKASRLGLVQPNGERQSNISRPSL
jgi:chorismate dehydratase